jgi:hypothetical protein
MFKLPVGPLIKIRKCATNKTAMSFPGTADVERPIQDASLHVQTSDYASGSAMCGVTDYTNSLHDFRRL